MTHNNIRFSRPKLTINKLRRRDVKGRVPDANAWSCQALAKDVRQLIGRSLLNDNLAAIVQLGIDRRQRRRYIERHAVVACGDGNLEMGNAQR